MKKHFMLSVAVEIDSENEIENMEDIDYSVKIESPDVKIKVVDIPETYGFSL